MAGHVAGHDAIAAVNEIDTMRASAQTQKLASS